MAEIAKIVMNPKTQKWECDTPGKDYEAWSNALSYLIDGTRTWWIIHANIVGWASR